jgi:predicted RNA-binding Zn-ribbon protein involved in translation (DUF1610 family)
VAPPHAAAACGSETATDADGRPHLVEVFRRHASAYRAQHHLTPAQARLVGDMERCRTAELGGRKYRCRDCGYEVPLYNSCGNRGCPQCQALAQARWIEARSARVLPVGHHHVVFTLPSELRSLARRHPRPLYDLLLQTAGGVLTSLSEERLGVRLGATLVLHTWTRELLLHPHVHCVVTAGGLTLDGKRWLDRKGFLFAVKQVRARFAARMLAGLDRLRQSGLRLDDDAGADVLAWQSLFARLPRPARWVVYTEPPFGRSTHVLQYLGRYTHRVGLSDQRLVAVSDDAVTFRTRGDDTVTMAPMELMRRYLSHVLPAGLNKIRHVGLYAAVHVKGALATAHRLLGAGDQKPAVPAAEPPAPETWDVLLERLAGVDPLACPQCGTGRLVLETLLLGPRSRGPPGWA